MCCIVLKSYYLCDIKMFFALPDGQNQVDKKYSREF